MFLTICSQNMGCKNLLIYKVSWKIRSFKLTVTKLFFPLGISVNRDFWKNYKSSAIKPNCNRIDQSWITSNSGIRDIAFLYTTSKLFLKSSYQVFKAPTIPTKKLLTCGTSITFQLIVASQYVCCSLTYCFLIPLLTMKTCLLEKHQCSSVHWCWC